MDYLIEAAGAQFRPALFLALKVFLEFDAPLCGPGAPDSFTAYINEKLNAPEMYSSGFTLLTAKRGEELVGVIETRTVLYDDRPAAGHISMLFVDGAHQRRGVGRALTDAAVRLFRERGIREITVNSSKFGQPFYEKYGFVPTDVEQEKDGFVFTPMRYVICAI